MSAAPTVPDDLLQWLAIPSISTGGGEPVALRAAAQWVADKVRAVGGECELLTIDGGNPLVVGELRASAGSGEKQAPTVLCYGHYDVQGVGDYELWRSPPFEPEIRDGRLFARGAADDKGNSYPLLNAACALAADGELPVNVRVVFEGEEEAGGASIAAWLAADERGADAAVVCDSSMIAPDVPAITVGLRGVVLLTFDVTAADRDLHSGLYGGSALNSLHALHAALAAVLPDERGRVRDELRLGIAPLSDAERESLAALPDGERALAAAGGRPAYGGAGAEYYERNGADAALDIDEIRGGDARTVIPARTRCTLSLRLAPGQSAQICEGRLLALLQDALPAGAQLKLVGSHRAEPSLVLPSEPAIVAAAEAWRRATGMAPAFVRSGGSIPIVSDLIARGIPTITTGFTLPDDPIHAPNESIWLRGLTLGDAVAREMLRQLAGLGTGS